MVGVYATDATGRLRATECVPGSPVEYVLRVDFDILTTQLKNLREHASQVFLCPKCHGNGFCTPDSRETRRRCKGPGHGISCDFQFDIVEDKGKYFRWVIHMPLGWDWTGVELESPTEGEDPDAEDVCEDSVPGGEDRPARPDSGSPNQMENPAG